MKFFTKSTRFILIGTFLLNICYLYGEKVRIVPSTNIHLRFYEPGDVTNYNLTLDTWPEEAIQGIVDAFDVVNNTFHINKRMIIGFIWSRDLDDLNALAQSYNSYSEVWNSDGLDLPDFEYKYPREMLNQLSSGTDFEGENICIAFNALTKWCYSKDREPHENEQDLITVTLHELTHGLGVKTSFNHNETIPHIYDKFLTDRNRIHILDAKHYPTRSSQDDILTGDQLYFSGPEAMKANNNNPIKLHAPPILSTASITHVDLEYEDNPNLNLMIPGTGYGQSTRFFGNVILGIFKDVGWDLKDSPPGPTTHTVSINKSTENDILLSSFNGTIRIESLTTKAVPLEIYSIHGKLFYKGIVNGYLELPVNLHSVYIIKTPANSYKIRL